MRDGQKIEAGCGIGEVSRAVYWMKKVDGNVMRSFQLVGCGIGLKLIVGC